MKEEISVKEEISDWWRRFNKFVLRKWMNTIRFYLLQPFCKRWKHKWEDKYQLTGMLWLPLYRYRCTRCTGVSNEME